jgi:NADPH:quinone reductase-like Zn-dependent oxidoreductase
VLSNIGADLVIVDDHNLVQKIKDQVGKEGIKLAFDAVSGEATNKLSQILSRKGLIIAYGALSLQNIQLNMGILMKKNITLKTFWPSHWLRETPKVKIANVYHKLIEMIANGHLQAEIDSTFPLESYKEAFKRSIEESRDGKVLLTGPSFN